MQLSDDDKKTITEWVQGKCGQMRCFCCGHAGWELASLAGIWIGFNTRTTRFHYAEGVPVVFVACINCGHLVPFSAAMIGLKPEPPSVADMQPAQDEK